MAGSDDEWTIASIFEPSILIYRYLNRNEEERFNKQIDQERDDEYYGHR